jgi:hypothetical protein
MNELPKLTSGMALNVCFRATNPVKSGLTFEEPYLRHLRALTISLDPASEGSCLRHE